MYSMTGFGRGEYRKDGIELVIELKSVNNRFLDISVRTPHIFAPCEELIRAGIRSALARGHVDVFVSCSDLREREKRLLVDVSAARAYAAAADQLSRETGLANDLSVTQLLRMNDVVRSEEAAAADDALIGALTSALSDALSALKEMRRKEGERLRADLMARIKAIARLRDEIAARAPLVAAEYRKKITERIGEYLGGKVDETRILTEAAIFADKCNIDEELTRLSSHIQEFYKICEGDPVGRKLDFLVQEFNRETNTIGSKASDSQIAKLVIEMKAEIEKIREQIQNLE